MGDDGRQDAVVIERTLDAPIGLVWKMWTDPDHFAAWYGPMGATVPEARLDVRVGGSRFVGMEMATPDGVHRMWFVGEHLEVEEGHRLVYTEAMGDEHGNALPPGATGMPDGHPGVTEVTVELEDLGGRTRMVMTHVGVPADSPGAMGWNMAFDKLEQQLAATPG